MMDINMDLLQWFISPLKSKARKAHLKRKAYLPFINNIWCGDLADMQLISKCNERFRVLLCIINIYSKYAWVIPLKDKKGTTITNAFQNFLEASNHKPNKIWLDKGSEF